MVPFRIAKEFKAVADGDIAHPVAPGCSSCGTVGHGQEHSPMDRAVKISIPSGKVSLHNSMVPLHLGQLNSIEQHEGIFLVGIIDHCLKIHGALTFSVVSITYKRIKVTPLL